jgi:hypothetical protein
MNTEGEGLENSVDRPEAAAEGEERSSEVFTIPNILSLLRILLTPVFAWSAVRGRPWLTFSIFLAAGATDALDGFTARMFHLKSHPPPVASGDLHREGRPDRRRRSRLHLA